MLVGERRMRERDHANIVQSEIPYAIPFDELVVAGKELFYSASGL